MAAACTSLSGEVFADDVIAQIIQGAYNCLYIGSGKEGVKELNLTSGNVRNLLLTDEQGESVFCRDLISYSDHELWIGTESGGQIRFDPQTKEYRFFASNAAFTV